MYMYNIFMKSYRKMNIQNYFLLISRRFEYFTNALSRLLNKSQISVDILWRSSTVCYNF